MASVVPSRRRVVENGAVAALLLSCGLLTLGPHAEQGRPDRRELAAYRLTASAFERFRAASERIAIVMARDSSLRAQPLFSQEVVQGGDVIEVSAALEARLRDHPDLSHALRAAKMSARDYTKFALTLVAARLALGFLESGVLKTVPPGPASENVAFVRGHRAAVDGLFVALGIEVWRSPPALDLTASAKASAVKQVSARPCVSEREAESELSGPRHVGVAKVLVRFAKPRIVDLSDEAAEILVVE
jgi:hypothetical protein